MSRTNTRAIVASEESAWSSGRCSLQLLSMNVRSFGGSGAHGYPLAENHGYMNPASTDCTRRHGEHDERAATLRLRGRGRTDGGNPQRNTEGGTMTDTKTPGPGGL